MATIHGTAAGETLYGTANDDTIYGYDGNDIIYGGNNSGVDLLYGGDGDDAIFGEAGVGWLYGEAGNDTLTGGAWNDILDGGDGDDTIIAGNGGFADTISGGMGYDVIEIQPLLTFNSGTLVIQSITGVEKITGKNATDTVTISSDYGMDFSSIELVNIDAIQGGASNQWLTGSVENNTIKGGGGADTIEGWGGNDALYGEAGADTFLLRPGHGTDTIWDYTDGSDKIRFVGTSADDFSDLTLTAVTSSRVSIAIDDVTVIVRNTTLSTFDAGDFLFT